MAIVSRLQLDHPALGTAGGAPLHAQVEALYLKLGDALSTRWYQITDFDEGESFDLEHNFDTPMANLRFDVYIYTGGTWVLLTNQGSPSLNDITIEATVGFEDTKVTVSNTNLGDNQLAAIVITNDPLYVRHGDIEDMDFTFDPDHGTGIVWNNTTKKFQSGHPLEPSFRLKQVASGFLTIRGGIIQLNDGSHLITYNGFTYGSDLDNLLTGNIFPGVIANDTTYTLYIDLQALAAEIVVPSGTYLGLSARVVSGDSHFDLFLATDVVDLTRYVPIGWLHSADTGNTFGVATGSNFGTHAIRKHDVVKALDGLTDVDTTTTPPEDGQGLVYDADSQTWVPGASGDASLKIQSVTDPNAVIKGGAIEIEDGTVVVTLNGGVYGADLTIDLDGIFGDDPANASAYKLYFNINALPAAALITTGPFKGLKARALSNTASNFQIQLYTDPEPSREGFIWIGWLRSADAGTVWSGTGSNFGTNPSRKWSTHYTMRLDDNDIEDVNVTSTTPQNREALIYDSTTSKWINRPVADFHPLRVTGPNILTLAGGSIIDGDNEYVTYSGTGETPTSHGVDLSLNLDTIFGSTPANDTTYFLFIDKVTLGTETFVQAESGDADGRRVYRVVQANFVLSTTRHRDTSRFVYIGFIKSGTTGNAWGGAGSALGVGPLRRHDALAQVAPAETLVDESITTAVATTSINHNFSGEPHGVLLTYDDGTTEIGLNPNSHLLDVTATQIKVSSLGLTFGSGQKLRVRAWRFPTQPAVAFYSRQFVSGWYTSTATTTQAHGLADVEDVKNYTVEEYNVSTGRYRFIDPSALVVNFDATNFYLDWTGLSPSATLQYRIIAGSSPLVAAIPLQYGGYTKFVGIGPGSYATLAAAVAAAVAGDSILVCRDTTEAAGDVTINVADIRVTWMPNATTLLSGAMTNGLRLTAARIKLDKMQLKLQPSATQARGVSIEAADCDVVGRVETNTAQTFTDLVHITSGGARAFVRVGVLRTLGTITNLETNNDGAGSSVVYGG